jgi:acetylornithine deacetylase
MLTATPWIDVTRMPVQDTVLKHIEKSRDEIIGFLQQLIRIPSVTEHEAEVQKFIAERVEQVGIHVDLWEPNLEELRKAPGYVPVKVGYEGRPNLVGVLKGRGGGRSLIFNGHVDVIPPEPRAAWTLDPWAGEIREGKIYGRGASDMKSGLASMIMAAKAIIDSGIKLNGDVMLETVIDEEYSGNGTLACVLRGYRADAAISCEMSDLQIQPAATGSMWFEILVRGRSASMSRIWEAVSAIEKGYRIVRAISDFESMRIADRRHPLYPDTRGSLACFPGMFLSGTYPSSPPDLCLIRGRMGTLPGETVEGSQREFIEFIQRSASCDPWLRSNPPEIKFAGYCGEPAEIPADHPICTTLIESFRRCTGENPIVRGHDGCTDARILIRYGIPTVIFGPGTITQMHATNEWARVDDVITATKVDALAMMQWCGVAE